MMDWINSFRFPSMGEIMREYLRRSAEERAKQFHDDMLDSIVDKWLEDEVNGDDDIPRYGTCGDLSRNDVRTIVRRCNAYRRQHGHSVRGFHLSQGFDEDKDDPRSYTLETLRKWLRDSRFK